MLVIYHQGAAAVAGILQGNQHLVHGAVVGHAGFAGVDLGDGVPALHQVRRNAVIRPKVGLALLRAGSQRGHDQAHGRGGHAVGLRQGRSLGGRRGFRRGGGVRLGRCFGLGGHFRRGRGFRFGGCLGRCLRHSRGFRRCGGLRRCGGFRLHGGGQRGQEGRILLLRRLQANGREGNGAVRGVGAGGYHGAGAVGQLKGELTGVHGAALQQLVDGQGEGVIARGSRVGVHELGGAHGFVIQGVNRRQGGQSAGAVVLHGDGDLVHGGIVGDRGAVARDLTQIVGVLPGGGKGEGLKGDAAVGGVGGGAQRGAGAVGVVVQGKAEVVALQRPAAALHVQGLVGGQGHIGGGGGVGVGERRHGALHGGQLAVDDPVIPGGAGQSAGAVIGDGHDHLVLGGIVGDAGNAAGFLGDIVNVVTGGIEGKIRIAEGGGAVAGDSGLALVAGRQRGVALAGQGELKGVAVRPVAAGQRFADLEQRGGRGLVGVGGVGVGKGGTVVDAAAVGHVGLQGAVFVAHRDGGRHRLVNGNAGNLRGLLGDGVIIGTHLLVGDGAERGLVALGAARNRNLGVTGRHGGIALTGQGEGKLIAVGPVAAGQGLGQLQGGRGGGRGVGVLKHHGGVVAAALKGFPAAVVLLDEVGDAGVGVGVFQGDVHLGQILGIAVNHVGIAAGHFLDGVPVGFADVRSAVGDVAEGDLAAGGVGGGAALGGRHGGLGGDGLVQVVRRRRLQREAELAVGQPGCAGSVLIALEGLEVDHFIVRVEGVGEGSHVAVRGVRGAILLHNLLQGVAAQRKLALAVVGDHDGGAVNGLIVGNAGDPVVRAGGVLPDVVLIGAGLGEGDGAEVEVDRLACGGSVLRLDIDLRIPGSGGIRLNGGRQRRISGADGLQQEAEGIAGQPAAAGQGFAAGEGVLHGVRGGRVGVGNGHNGGGIVHPARGDHAVAAVGDDGGVPGGNVDLAHGVLGARGQALDLGGLAVFQGDGFAAGDAAGGRAVNGIAVAAGQGGVGGIRQVDLHGKGGVGGGDKPVGGLYLLGDLQAALGLVAQAAVVAQVQVADAVLQVPVIINAASGGFGDVLALVADLVVNGAGHTALFGALSHIGLAIGVLLDHAAVLVGGNGDGNGAEAVGRLGLPGLIRVVFQLVVIGLALLEVGDGLGAGFVHVQGSVLRVVVEAVVQGGNEGGGGIADGDALAVLLPGVGVGVEVDLAVHGVVGDILHQVVVRAGAGLQVAAHLVLQTNRVQNADGVSVGDVQRSGAAAVIPLQVVVAQGQHAGRDAHLNAVAGFAVGAVGDGDQDLAQVGMLGIRGADRAGDLVGAHVGIHIAVGGFFNGGVDVIREGDAVEGLDLHKAAKGIVKGHIAAAGGVAVLFNEGGAGQVGGHRPEDALKHALQAIGAGGGKVILVGVRGCGAPVKVVIPQAWGVGGVGVVAGNRVHELVCERGVAVGNAVGGFGTLKNADGIHFGAILLYVVGLGDGGGSNARLEPAGRGRGAVRKEDDDLLRIAAGLVRVRGQGSLGALQAIVGLGGTGGVNGIHGRRQLRGTGAFAHGQVLHDLGIVVEVVAVPVGVVADFFAGFAGKLHDGKPDLLVFIADLGVLVRGVANKVQHGGFQRRNALGCVRATHGIRHTAGGIQHHHHIQRDGFGLGGGGSGGHGGQSHQKIRPIGFFNRLALQRAGGELNGVRVHGFIGPDTAGGSGVVALDFVPGVEGVWVGDCSRLCGIGRAAPLQCLHLIGHKHGGKQDGERQKHGLKFQKSTVHCDVPSFLENFVSIQNRARNPGIPAKSVGVGQRPAYNDPQ